MRIWIVAIGEPIPVKEGIRDRLHRAGYFAHFLANHGHDVVWWTSTFDHFQKNHFFLEDTTVTVNDHLILKLIHSTGYKKNISIGRFLDHRKIGEKLSNLIRREVFSPDIILSSLPTIELSLESVRYGKDHNIPVVLDLRDMWPDIFVDTVPKIVRPLARLMLSSLFSAASEACSGATAITGITEAFVEWGLRRGRRAKSEFDKAFPMGVTSTPLSQENIRKAEDFWDHLGILGNSKDFTVVFLGTLGVHCDYKLIPIFEAARQLKAKGKAVRFVICGSGDRLEQYKRMTLGTPQVIFPGWVDAAAMYALMRRSSVGIDPLPDRYDFHATINNKAIEYMSAGLPVISCPQKGILADLLKNKHCGMSYDYGDVNGLINILLSLYDNQDLLKIMSLNSKQVYEKNFVAEKVYQEMMEHLEYILMSTREIGP